MINLKDKIKIKKENKNNYKLSIVIRYSNCSFLSINKSSLLV